MQFMQRQGLRRRSSRLAVAGGLILILSFGK